MGTGCVVDLFVRWWRWGVGWGVGVDLFVRCWLGLEDGWLLIYL